MISNAWRLWKWCKRWIAEDWPSADGIIDAVNVEEKSDFWRRSGPKTTFVAILTASSQAGQEAGTTRYQREFDTMHEAREFLRDLRGKHIQVRYDPDHPSRTMLLDEDVDALIAKHDAVQTEMPTQDAQQIEDLPFWGKVLLLPIAVLAAIGFGASLWVHFNALMGKLVLPQEYFFLLHVGIFVVWIPTVFIAQKRVKGSPKKDYWEKVMKGAPNWMRYVSYGAFGYAFINFALFFASSMQSTSKGIAASSWRGFSGHWMAFYSAAFVTIYAAINSKNSLRCKNGHPISSDNAFCIRCGEVIDRH